MDLKYTSPIKYDFIPTPESDIIFEFKLKGHKKIIRVDVDVNIFYKDPFIIGRVFLKNSGMRSAYTSVEDTIHRLKFKIPEFQNRTQSYVNVSIGLNFYDKVIIEDMRIIEDKIIKDTKIIEDKITIKNMTYKHPSAAMAVPNLESKIGDIQKLKEIVTKGYRDILKREPDPIGLDNYMNQLKNGLGIESFYNILKSSDEYKSRFGTHGTVLRTTQRDIIQFKEAQKVAIASIVRDEERSGNLGRFLDCCRDLERYHKNLVYIFIEGDSSDKTYEILKKWTGQRKGSILEKINKGHSPFGKTRDPKRTIHLAKLRNRLINLILSISDVDEALIIDANYGWKGDLISSLREANAHIAAPLAVMHKDSNGKYIFYDIWVFRKNGKEFWPLYPYTEDMRFDRPVDVDSVGSGYLVKRQVLEAGVKYDGNNDSEQVGFCNSARNLGFTIKVNPKTYIIKGGSKE